jgi:hypothetical protein
MFKIIIKGPEAGKIQRLADTMHGQLVQAVSKAVKDAEGISKRNFLSGQNYHGKKNPTPGPVGVLGWKSGHLKGSIGSRVEEAGRIIRGILSAGPLPYARAHEEGVTTRPHTIKPRRGGVLHWVKGGVDMFARSVKHPGSKIPKRSYLTPALEAVTDRLKMAMEDIFKRFGK